MDWTLIIEVAKSFGLPVAILLALAIAIVTVVATSWQAGKKLAAWLAKEVVIPARNRHFSFLDKIEGTSERQVELMAQQKEAFDRQADMLERLNQTIGTHGAILETHSAKLESHSEKLDELLRRDEG